ncbi:hypothetical protein [Vagococcus martis]
MDKCKLVILMEMLTDSGDIIVYAMTSKGELKATTVASPEKKSYCALIASLPLKYLFDKIQLSKKCLFILFVHK